MGTIYSDVESIDPAYAARRFERKHSGMHIGLLIALPTSLLMWIALIALLAR